MLVGTTWDRMLAPPWAGGRETLQRLGPPRSQQERTCPSAWPTRGGRDERDRERLLFWPPPTSGSQEPKCPLSTPLHSWSCGLGRQVLLPPCTQGEGCESGPVGIKPPRACQAGSHCDPIPDQHPEWHPDSWLKGHTHTPTGWWVPRAGRGWSECREVPWLGPASLCLSDCTHGSMGVCLVGAASTYAGVSLLLGRQVVHDDEFL